MKFQDLIFALLATSLLTISGVAEVATTSLDQANGTVTEDYLELPSSDSLGEFELDYGLWNFNYF